MFLPGKRPGEREEFMNTILVLKDGTKITLGDNSSRTHLLVASASRTAMVAVWEKLTKDNLQSLQMKVEGQVTGEYGDMLLVSETSTVEADGSVQTEFVIREKTDIEKLQELVASQSAEIAALKEGQGVQDGAIEDLGAVTSTLAEKVEGGQA